METSDELCAEIHRLLDFLPTFKEPHEVPFTNGLYFFYEKGEVSPHSWKGCIVRVGNHSRSQNRLKERLGLHYSRNKNSSAFRKLVGGAILRRISLSHLYLLPGPGQGHWEKQDMPTCEKCKPIEIEVSKLLRSNFWFRCIQIKDKSLRKTLEKKLIATISLCPICQPSDSWLGRLAYSERVRCSGLWNINHVFDEKLKLKAAEIRTLKELVALTLKYTRVHI